MRFNFRTAATITLTLVIGISIPAFAQQRVEPVSPQAQTKMPEVPAEMARRIAALQSGMQPSAKAWVEQQARTESQKKLRPTRLRSKPLFTIDFRR